MLKLNNEIDNEDVLSAIKESLDGLISGYEEGDVTLQIGISKEIDDSLLVMVYIEEELVGRFVFDLDFLRSTDSLLGSDDVLDYIA